MADAEPVPAPEVALGSPPNAPPADPAPPAEPAPAVVADPPGPTWGDLVSELELEPHWLACHSRIRAGTLHVTRP
jgi:hypothetical protein